MQRLPHLLSTLSAALLFACAPAAHAGSYDPYFERIQRASWHADSTALQGLSGELASLAATAPAAPEAQYLAAYADYRLANAAQHERKPELSAPALLRAQGLLEALSVRQTPWQADALALLSAVYGLRIALDPSASAALGIKSGAAIGQATRLAPDNPRVQLFAGIAKLYTPAMYGGSTLQAIAAFDLAIADAKASAPSAANWGLDDAYLWRGIAQKSAGKPDAARASYQQALAVAPEHGWAAQLLNSVDQAK